MNPIEYILTQAGTVAITSAIVVFVGRLFISKSFEAAMEKFKAMNDKSLETHKAELALENERLKATLKIAELEHHIKYGKLHEDRLIAIKKVYGSLNIIQTKLLTMIILSNGRRSTDEFDLRKNASDAVNAFEIDFSLSRIYFDSHICDRLLVILRLARGILMDMNVLDSISISNRETVKKEEELKNWRDRTFGLNSDIDLARQEIEIEFRKLIGVQLE